MPVIDPSTNLGKVRLRCGDWADLPLLPNEVIESALSESNNSVPKAASLCAQYILAMLTSRTHRKLAQLETWGNEQFENYVKFIQMTILNPNLAAIAPIPYAGGTDTEHPLIQFQKDWAANYQGGTQSEQLHRDANRGFCLKF